MYQQYTHYWNVARLVVILGAFTAFFAVKAFGFGGFAPSLDVANSYEFNQVNKDAQDKDNRDAYDRVKEDRANDRDSSDSDQQKASEYERDHSA